MGTLDCSGVSWRLLLSLVFAQKLRGVSAEFVGYLPVTQDSHHRGSQCIWVAEGMGNDGSEVLSILLYRVCADLVH